MEGILLEKDAQLLDDIEADVKNKFRFEWLEKSIKIRVQKADKSVNKKTETETGDTDITLTHEFSIKEWIVKIRTAGKAKCMLCTNLINYGNRGQVAIVDHCHSKSHEAKVTEKLAHYSLPASYTSQPLHPLFGNVKAKKPEQVKPKLNVSLDDRVKNAEVNYSKF